MYIYIYNIYIYISLLLPSSHLSIGRAGRATQAEPPDLRSGREASVADESQNPSGRLVAARVAALEASHQAEVNELKRAPWWQLVRPLGVDVHP